MANIDEKLINYDGLSRFYSDLQSTDLTAKQDVLVEGNNIEISGSTISAEGYLYDDTTGCLKQISQRGYTNSVAGQNSVTLGQGNTVSGEASSVIGGQGNNITGDVSVAMGYNNHVTASFSGAFGQSNTVTANNSFAFGKWNLASGVGAICGGGGANGATNVASGVGSAALGTYVKALGYSSFACGWGQSVTDDYNTASGDASFVSGLLTKALNAAETAEGNCNVSHSANSSVGAFGNAGNTLYSLGNGTSYNARKNAVEVMQNGDVYINGIGNYVGTNTKVQDATIKTLQDVINNKQNITNYPLIYNYVGVNTSGTTSITIDGTNSLVYSENTASITWGAIDNSIPAGSLGEKVIVNNTSASSITPTLAGNYILVGNPVSAIQSGEIGVYEGLYVPNLNKWIVKYYSQI